MHGPVRFALPALAMMTLAVGAGSAGRPVIMVVRGHRFGYRGDAFRR
jgi:hypothetical protein